MQYDKTDLSKEEVGYLRHAFERSNQLQWKDRLERYNVGRAFRIYQKTGTIEKMVEALRLNDQK